MSTMQKWITFRPWERHSLVLMVAGLVYILVGAALWTAGDLSARQEISLVLALSMMSLRSWAIIFIFSGLLACFSSRWPSFSETWGYMVLAGLSSGWSAMYFFGYILSNAPVTNVTLSAVWGLMAFLWWAISGLMNPSRLTVVMADEVT